MCWLVLSCRVRLQVGGFVPPRKRLGMGPLAEMRQGNGKLGSDAWRAVVVMNLGFRPADPGRAGWISRRRRSAMTVSRGRLDHAGP